MSDLGSAALLGVFIGTIFGAIFITYFVKIARGLVRLMDVLRNELEQKSELHKRGLESQAEIAAVRERAGTK